MLEFYQRNKIQILLEGQRYKMEKSEIRKNLELPGVPTPIVSPREISKQPISKSSLATYATFDGDTAPSMGQPTTHDIYLIENNDSYFFSSIEENLLLQKSVLTTKEYIPKHYCQLLLTDLLIVLRWYLK